MQVVDFGWPLPKRQSHFQDLSRDPNAKRYEHEIDFMGQARILPVWRIPLGLPRYRLLNGRTSSLQQEWLAKNSSQPKEFFTGDPEREAVQKVQHQLLKELIHVKDLLPYFTNPTNKQSDYLILDHLGFVVNGNRRLCAWRELLASNAQKYAHFANIDVMVLPKASEEAIDELESALQIEPNILADYSWHAFANMLIDRIQLHNLDVPRLARMYKKREPQIREYIDMHAYAVEYLKARGKEGRWSEVTDTEYAFKQMVSKRKQISGTGEKRLFETGAFLLLDDPEGGRLYDYIPDLCKYRDRVFAELLQAFRVDDLPEVDDDPLGIDPEEVKNQRLAEIIDEPKNRSKAIEIIKDTIDTQELVEREKDSANYVLKQLQTANAAIQSALTAINRPGINRAGVVNSIDTIEKGIANLRRWLESNG